METEVKCVIPLMRILNRNSDHEAQYPFRGLAEIERYCKTTRACAAMEGLAHVHADEHERAV